MLMDADITIAYKCSSCGSFKFFNVSLFELLSKKDCIFNCHCEKSGIRFKKTHGESYKMVIPCIGCGLQHTFEVTHKELLSGRIRDFTCPVTSVKQCFMGKDAVVRKKVDNLEKELDRLIDAFGYDNYFINTQVMFDLLNKIHDIAERGNLYCECGNNDIELVLLADRIYLNCKRCFASRTIFATSNEHLKNISSEQEIQLTGKLSYYKQQEDATGSGSYARKT
ncbi:MAG TPA: hypothetical protein GXX14_06570 [Clostridiaceae bacterium]|nr:hypothetical protein [Clostridiaceae bacterium]